MTFSGRIGLVTGATSGIGEACALELAKQGASLVVTGRNPERGAAVLELMREQGADAVLLTGDVRDSAFCDELVRHCVDRFGRLDVLVNSAGICRVASTLDTTDEEWSATMNTNVDGTFFTSRSALRVMVRKRSGSIVNIASDWGLVGASDAAAYCASKGAVILLSKSMALEHATDGIRVNAVCPGDTDTPMMEEDRRQRGRSEERARQEAATSSPIGRMATPEEVAKVVCFLAAAAASYVTGSAWPVDGGHTAA